MDMKIQSKDTTEVAEKKFHAKKVFQNNVLYSL